MVWPFTRKLSKEMRAIEKEFPSDKIKQPLFTSSAAIQRRASEFNQFNSEFDHLIKAKKKFAQTSKEFVKWVGKYNKKADIKTETRLKSQIDKLQHEASSNFFSLVVRMRTVERLASEIMASVDAQQRITKMYETRPRDEVMKLAPQIMDQEIERVRKATQQSALAQQARMEEWKKEEQRRVV
jgi:hypothetical protein